MRPEKEQHKRYSPISEQNRQAFFDQPRRRSVGIHPAKMRAQQAGDDARSFLAEDAAVRENGGQFEDGIPHALQVIEKPKINGEQSGRSDEINLIGGRSGCGDSSFNLWRGVCGTFSRSSSRLLAGLGRSSFGFRPGLFFNRRRAFGFALFFGRGFLFDFFSHIKN